MSYSGYYENEDAGESKHIYYNVRIDNADYAVDNSASNRCAINQQTQNILSKQSDYEVAVESWACRAHLPVFIATIKQGTNTNLNLMPFSVTYSYTVGGVTTNYQTSLLWTPSTANDASNTETPTPKTPAVNNGIQDLKTSQTYYDCNDYQTFVTIINTALKTSYDAFNLAHGGVHAEECWLQYDQRTGFFGMVAPASYALGVGGTPTAPTTDKATVCFDALLYKYIDTIQSEFLGYNQPNGKDYRIRFEVMKGFSNSWSLGNHYAGEITNKQTQPPDYIIMEQERDCRFLWSNITQILITTSSINVRDEYMPPRIAPEALVPLNNSFNIDRQSVLSYIDYNDVSPSVGEQSSIHRDIFYRAPYHKWTDLVGDSPLNNINIEFYYLTEDSFILPLRVPAKSSANVKLVFRKKLKRR